MTTIESSSGERFFRFERRFLVSRFADIDGLSLEDEGNLVVKGLLWQHGGEALTVHRRMVVDGNPGDFVAHRTPTLDFKGIRANGGRQIHSCAIDETTAAYVMKGTTRRLHKRRYDVNSTAGPCAVDLYRFQNGGLVIGVFVSIEPLTNLEPPFWCRADVSEDPRFEDEALAANPLCNWTSSDLDDVGLHRPARTGP